MIITNQPFFDACYVYEAGCSNFQFNNRSTNCALGRDVITNDDIYACTQNNLPKARFSTISKSNNRVAEEAAPALTLTATVTVSTVLVTTNIKQSNGKKINERYYRNKISQCNNDLELQTVINWIYIYSDSRDDLLDGSASSQWLQLIQDYVTCPTFRNKLVEMTKPNKKSVGSSYSYVHFDVDNNEQKLMACVTSEKLFCTRDKIHTETNTIVSIESSPPPEGVYFLDCYATTM